MKVNNIDFFAQLKTRAAKATPSAPSTVDSASTAGVPKKDPASQPVSSADDSMDDIDQLQDLIQKFDSEFHLIAAGSKNPQDVLGHPVLGDLAYRILKNIAVLDPEFAKKLAKEAIGK